MRVLVVDDDRDTLDSMALFLEYSGCEVYTAPDGETALALAQAHRPTVVLLDLAMPGMGRDELARLLRRLPDMEQALLVCISGCQGEDSLRRSREAGCDHHLLKPVDLDHLDRLLWLR